MVKSKSIGQGGISMKYPSVQRFINEKQSFPHPLGALFFSMMYN